MSFFSGYPVFPLTVWTISTKIMFCYKVNKIFYSPLRKEEIMKGKWTLFLAVMLILAWSTSPVGAQDTVKIGVPLPLTGAHAKFGEAQQMGFKLAFEEINQAGGIKAGPFKGKKIEPLYEDTVSKPETARAAVEKLITQNKIPMIVGEYSSQNSYSVAAVANAKEVPYICITGSTDKLTASGWKWVFRINPAASEYPEAAWDFLSKKVNPKSMAILYENTDFGKSAAAPVKWWCEKNKIKVTNYEAYDKGAIDFKPMLTKVKAQNPEVVYMVAYLNDAKQLVNQSVELGVKPKLFLGHAAGFTLPEFIDGTGKNSENLMTASLWAEDVKYPGAKEFAANFKNKFKKVAEYHATEAYACAYVVADVLARTKSLKNEDLRQALLATNMMTAFGPVKFTSYKNYEGQTLENQNKLPALLMQVQKGKLTTIWPESVATAKPVYPLPGR